MAISVQSNVEVNERISRTQNQVAEVMTTVGETNELLKETVINQRHIEEEVDDARSDARNLKTHVSEQIGKVHQRIDDNIKETTVKNTQLRLVKWVAAIAVTSAVTWFFTSYLPNKDEVSEIGEIKTLLIEIFKDGK